VTNIGRRGFIGGIAALIAATSARLSPVKPKGFTKAELQATIDEFNRSYYQERLVMVDHSPRVVAWSEVSDAETWDAWADVPVGTTIRIKVPEKFELIPFGFRTPADNQGEIHGLVMSTSGDRELLRANRGDALNA
jgi:hypothetical protein